MKIATIVALTLCLSGNALADHKGGKGGHDGSAYMEKLTRKLELTEDQAAAVKALHQTYMAEKKALRERHREGMREILNKEQLEKYTKMKEKHRHKKGHK